MAGRRSHLVVLSVFGVLPLVVGVGGSSSGDVGPASGVVAAGGSAGQTVDGLTADHIEHDFGAVRIDGGKVTARFNLKNGTAGATRVTELYTSCMCTSVRLEFADSRVAGPFGMPGHDLPTSLNRSFKPGEALVALVTFDPAAHGMAGVGAVTRQVLFQTAERGRLILTIKANVLPPKDR